MYSFAVLQVLYVEPRCKSVLSKLKEGGREEFYPWMAKRIWLWDSG